jgi:hypothetical protein
MEFNSKCFEDMNEIEDMNENEDDIYLKGDKISIGEDPKNNCWCFYPLYRTNQIGNTDMWQIGFDPDISSIVRVYGSIKTKTGDIGKMRYSSIKVDIKKSGRDIQQQALLEARKMYKDKYRKDGYRPIGNNFDLIGTQCLSKTKKVHPQLANILYLSSCDDKYKKGVKLNNSALNTGVMCQPKIDGIRAMAWRSDIDNTIHIYSRTHKEYLWLDDIKNQLEEFFLYLPEGIGLDGELYSTTLSFNEISGSIRTSKKKSEYNHMIKYFIFDVVILDMVVEDRIKLLYNAYKNFIKDTIYEDLYLIIIQGIPVFSEEQIKNYHDQYKKLGFEGIMVRKLSGNYKSNINKNQYQSSLYKPNRNNNLLKYKDFMDDEGECVDVIDGKGKDSGLAIFLIKNKNGKILTMRPRGSNEQRKYWFLHKSECIGHIFTYRYQETDENGVPRFGIVVGKRDYE